MTSSLGVAVAPGAPVGCSWAKAIFVAAASVAAARMIRKNFIRVLPWWCLTLVFAPSFEGPWGSVQEVRLPAACGYSMGFLQHYYVKVSTHCVRPITQGPAHTPELPGRGGDRKRRRGAAAPAQSLPGSVAFPQRTAQDGLRLVPHTNSVGHVRRAAVIATYKGLCRRRQPMNCCTFMIFTELCGDS